MHTPFLTLVICLAAILYVLLVLALANIITPSGTGGGGKSSLYADPATGALIISQARADCGCRCHSEQMFPGMRCMDCYGEPCDEGTQE